MLWRRIPAPRNARVGVGEEPGGALSAGALHGTMLSPNVVPDFTRLRVAVVGDLIADRYLFARPTRISREAPVLVMRHDHEVIGAGGAANVARNL